MSKKLATEISEKRIFDLLPDEISLDILSRLPVKSIKRFTCVCKSWFAAFQNPTFIRNYHSINAIRGSNLRVAIKTVDPSSHAIENSLGFDCFLLSNVTMQITESIHVPDLSSLSTIIGECEGLIWSYSAVYDDSSSIGILNPATKEFKLLSKSSHEHGFFVDSRAMGLGYDYKTNDYKLVRFVVNSLDKETDCYVDFVELYTLSTDSWKVISFPFGCIREIRHTLYNTYLNGRYHWWMQEREEILAFDMAEETFHKTTAFPIGFDFGWQGVEFVDLRVFRNQLAVIVGCSTKTLDLWVMKEYGVTESWTKELVIEPLYGLRDGVSVLLGMWRNGEWFYSTYKCALKLFDPNTKVVKDIGNQDAHCKCNELSDHECSCNLELGVVIYTESLFSLAKR